VSPTLASGLRVLLVEDEPINRALVRAILGRARDPRLPSIELHEATTIAAARDMLAVHDVDVVLLDVRLPDGNGLDLAAEMRAAGNRARVVVVSASVLPAEQMRALASGADAFLGKPFGAEQLIDALADAATRPAAG
jgi:two-component system KDP operon response regulator KdpE